MENSSPNPSFSICDIRIQKQMSRSFGKSFPQKIVFAKLRPHCSATLPETLRAEHQRKCPFLFRRNFTTAKSEKQGTFFFGVASEARQWRNDSFHIGILLEKGSDFIQETQQMQNRLPLMGRRFSICWGTGIRTPIVRSKI